MAVAVTTPLARPSRRCAHGVPAQWLRHSCQALCLALFVGLFWHVWWPYSAVPSPERVLVLPDGRSVPAHYALDLARKEVLPAETMLWLDPLPPVAAGLASRRWVGALGVTAGVLLLCLVVPRWFCSYTCPLGTLIGISDRLLWRRSARRLRPGWGALRFGLLVAVLAAAAWGLLLVGYVAPLPLLSRGMTAALTPLHLGLSRGWHNVPPAGAQQALAVALSVLPLLLGFLGPRVWCRCVCPSGALLSLVSLLSRRQRRLRSFACTACGKCLRACPFGAVREDFTTSAVRCTFCRTCERACPAAAITFAGSTGVRLAEDSRPDLPALGRRGFLAAAVAGTGAALAPRRRAGAAPLRPPGSLPEPDFLGACIRCSACIRACPNSVLQPLGLQHGPEGLWTPVAVPDWSGCDPSCNNCGQVCPTGAIRALPLLEKRSCRMGLAMIDRATCLPWAGTGECELCADECRAAGYDAIEFERVGVVVDEDGLPTEGSGRRAPVMVAATVRRLRPVPEPLLPRQREHAPGPGPECHPGCRRDRSRGPPASGVLPGTPRGGAPAPAPYQPSPGAVPVVTVLCGAAVGPVPAGNDQVRASGRSPTPSSPDCHGGAPGGNGARRGQSRRAPLALPWPSPAGETWGPNGSPQRRPAVVSVICG